MAITYSKYGQVNKTKAVCVIQYGNGTLDPPTIQSCRYLKNSGYDVTLITSPTDYRISTRHEEYGIRIVRTRTQSSLPVLPGPFKSVLRWMEFTIAVRRTLSRINPALIIPIMFHGIASLPAAVLKRSDEITIFPCIYDIPSVLGLGKLDHQVYKSGLKRLSFAKGVWGSDAYKLDIIRKRTQLPEVQHVCHNCPERDYLKGLDRNTARAELINFLSSRGMYMKQDDFILVRAGGVGPNSALPETLNVLATKPKNLKFVIMGRPNSDFLSTLNGLVKKLDLEGRVIVLDRPQTSLWKTVLAAADYGHLIHTPPHDLVGRDVFENNSSLSNNGFFQYMAASTPFMLLDDERHRSLPGTEYFTDFVDRNSIEPSIARILNFVTQNTANNFKRGEAARRLFQDEHNWELQFEPIYKAMVERYHA